MRWSAVICLVLAAAALTAAFGRPASGWPEYGARVSNGGVLEWQAASDESDGLVSVFTSSAGGAGPFAQRLDGTGAKLWNAGSPLPLAPSASYNPIGLSLATRVSYFAAWWDAANDRIIVQKFGVNGNLLWTTGGRVASDESANNPFVEPMGLSPTSGGGVMVIFRRSPSNGMAEIWMVNVQSSGNPLAPVKLVPAYPVAWNDPGIKIVPSGIAFLLIHSDGTHIVADKFSGTGTHVWGPVSIHDNVEVTAVHPDGLNGALVGFVRYVDSQHWNIEEHGYARIDSSGGLTKATGVNDHASAFVNPNMETGLGSIPRGYPYVNGNLGNDIDLQFYADDTYAGDDYTYPRVCNPACNLAKLGKIAMDSDDDSAPGAFGVFMAYEVYRPISCYADPTLTKPKVMVQRINGNGDYWDASGSFQSGRLEVALPNAAITAGSPVLFNSDPGKAIVAWMDERTSSDVYALKVSETGSPYTYANVIPVAVAGSGYAGIPGDEIELDGSGSYDPDGGALGQYYWTLTSNAAGCSWTVGPNVAKPKIKCTTPGTRGLALRVLDNEGLYSEYACTSVSFSSSTNQPPVITAPAATGFKDVPIVITGTASDSGTAPGNKVMAIDWNLGSSQCAVDNVVLTPANPPWTSVSIVGELTCNSRGTKTITLTASDDGTPPLPSSLSQTITVNNRNPVAAITSNSPQVAPTPILLMGTDSTDPDGDALTYFWEVISGPPGCDNSGLSNPSSDNTNLQCPPGTVHVKLTVMDNYVPQGISTAEADVEFTTPPNNPNGNGGLPVGSGSGLSVLQVDCPRLSYENQTNITVQCLENGVACDPAAVSISGSDSKLVEKVANKFRFQVGTPRAQDYALVITYNALSPESCTITRTGTHAATVPEMPAALAVLAAGAALFVLRGRGARNNFYKEGGL